MYQVIELCFIWVCNLVPPELWANNNFLSNIINKLDGKTINILKKENSSEEEDYILDEIILQYDIIILVLLIVLIIVL